MVQDETEDEVRRYRRGRQSMVDRSKYAGAIFIRFDDLADGPQQKVIVNVEDGQYERVVVAFDDGTCLSLNKTNVRTLIRAYGKDDQNWIGQRVELSQGTVNTKDGARESVLLTPLGTAAESKSKIKPQRPRSDDLDDEVPFH
jgi:hypothetical protein